MKKEKKIPLPVMVKKSTYEYYKEKALSLNVRPQDYVATLLEESAENDGEMGVRTGAEG